MDSISCSPKYLIYIGKNVEKTSRKSLCAEMRHNNDVTDQCAASVQLFFIFSLGLVRVCEIEISHMVKNNGNPDLVCAK